MTEKDMQSTSDVEILAYASDIGQAAFSLAKDVGTVLLGSMFKGASTPVMAKGLV